jgi:hypothetical protein
MYIELKYNPNLQPSWRMKGLEYSTKVHGYMKVTCRDVL